MAIYFSVEGIDEDLPQWSYTGFDKFLNDIRPHASSQLKSFMNRMGHGSANGKICAKRCSLMHSPMKSAVMSAYGPSPRDYSRLGKGFVERDSDYDKMMGLRLAFFMAEAARTGKPLEFG